MASSRTLERRVAALELGRDQGMSAGLLEKALGLKADATLLQSAIEHVGAYRVLKDADGTAHAAKRTPERGSTDFFT